MDKNIKQFKTDYANVKKQIKQIKQKLCELRKELKPVTKTAHRLFNRGEKTMYIEGKRRMITPKFNGLDRIMENLNAWMDIDFDIQQTIKNI